MKRASIFVEGQTEQHFVSRLLTEIAGASQLQISNWKVAGGGGSRTLINHSISQGIQPKWSVQVLDSGGDGNVVSDLIELGPVMLQRGISLLIGLRDIYPFQKADLVDAYRAMKKTLAPHCSAARVVVPTVEVEAWFIAEWTHFQRVDPSITNAAVQARMG